MASRPPKSNEPNILQVFIFRDGRFWGTECFSQSEVIIGRSPEVDLQLEDDIISRSHASVVLSPDGVILEDLGSSNGTYVNGEAIDRCYIEPRDEVSLGAFSLKFKSLGGPKPKQRFAKDETRIADREEGTQRASTPEGLGAGYPAATDQDEHLSTQPSTARGLTGLPEAEVQLRRKQEIAEALREEIDSDFGAMPTEALRERPASLVDADEHLEKTEAEDQEYAIRTQVEEAPFPIATPARPIAAAPGTAPEYREPLPAPPVGFDVHPETGAEVADYEVTDRSRAEEGARDILSEFGAAPQPVAPQPVAPQPADLDLALPGMAAGDEVIPAAFQEQAALMAEPVQGFERPEPALPVGVQEEEPYDESEEEEFEQRDFVEPFSLLNNLIRENFAEPPVATLSDPIVEVIDYSSSKQVLQYHQVHQGKKHRIGPNRFLLVHHNDKAGCKVFFSDTFSGGVITGGQTRPIDELKTASNQAGTFKGANQYFFKLIKGDYANLIHEGGGSFIRFVNPPKLPAPKHQFRVDQLNLKIFGSTFLGHIIFIVALGLLAPDKEAVAEVDLDRFAKISVKDMMEKPEEEVEIPLDQLPEPDKKEEEKKEEEKKEEEKKEEPKKEKKVRKKTKQRAAKGDGGTGGGGVGIMAALGNLSQKKPSQNIVTAVSNLDAVRVPGGKSRYKVSGLVTKLGTSQVVISRGQGVGVKGGIELLRGGKGRGGMAGIGPGALGGGKSGKRSVGGVVFKAPKRNMRVRGTLSREAIAAVVKKHLREIQYCYEKNLLLNPNLSGKLEMEWTISTSGSVTVVKTKINTMQSPAVAMCVSAKINTWQFPKPKGGIVVVNYPFIFNAIGF